MHDLLPCKNSKSTRTFLEYIEILVLKWPGYSPDMNHIENVWNKIQNEIGNQNLCKMKIYGRENV